MTNNYYVHIYKEICVNFHPKKRNIADYLLVKALYNTRIAFTICSKLNGWIASLNRDVSDFIVGKKKHRPTYGHPKIAINEMKEVVRFQALKL